MKNNNSKGGYNPYPQDGQENIIHDEEEIGIEQNINPQNNNINLIDSNVNDVMMGESECK